MKRKYWITVVFVLSIFMLISGCTAKVEEVDPVDTEPVTKQEVEDKPEVEDKADLEDKNAYTKLLFDEDLPDVVMSINGYKVTRDHFLSEYEQMKTLYKKLGLDVEDIEVQVTMQGALVTSTINTTILNLEADKRGVTVSDEEVDKRVREVIAQYPTEDAFYEMLSELNTTLDDFRIKMGNQIKVSKLLSEIEAQFIEENDFINFTEEQKIQMYEQYKEKVGDMPDYEEIKDDIDSVLEASRLKIIVEDYIDNLIENSEIEFYFNKDLM
ncbi:MAG: SurA N-terminal domain-containing protein [Gudongella sp.]|nr:SurA N-terminal domain-containing protein [Gudongella sp.]